MFCSLNLQKLRSLQNCLEKNQLKCKEAANIMTNYLQLKRHLQVSCGETHHDLKDPLQMGDNDSTIFLNFFFFFVWQEESLTFQGQIDGLEAEIMKYRRELQEVQDMNNKAQLSKETAIVIYRCVLHNFMKFTLAQIQYI